MKGAVGNSTVDLPPDSLVNFNFAITALLLLIALPLHGIVLLPVLLLKKLCRQPHQYLYSNYLASSLAIILGFGFYREVQVGRYIFQGFEAGLKKTACHIVKFVEFPVTASNYCLFLLGFERFIALHYNKTIDWPTLLLLIALPWALGISRHIVQLSSINHYRSIPYLGLCVNFTEEKKKRMVIAFLMEFAVPFLLASTTIFVAYAKAFSKWKSIKTRQKDFLSSTEITKLRHEERSVLKKSKLINLAAAFFILRFCTTLIYRVLYSVVEDDNSSQEMRDRAGVVGVFFLLLDVAINPILFFIFNTDLRKALCDKMPMLMKIPLIYPYDEDEEEDVVEVETIEMQDITEPN